ncbi:hypothetical protein BKA63DRAFT_517547 [Paraphoma chrysanthemicola]|nr:hypothetical protein BKA63DRAFT_517547 [Paraphoma chrysanthemicola]
MVKKIETGTLVKQHQVSKGVSAAHLPPVNHRLIVRDHEQSSQECLITANSSIDSVRSVSSFFATTPYPEDEDKFTRGGLKCEHVSPAHEILADASLASECQAVEHQEEDAQLLYQTLLPFSTTAMPSQVFSVHSLSEEKQPEEVDWIDKAVHGSSPKLNTLDQVRLQMQHRNIHANDVGQYPTMVPTVSLIPDHDNDEAVGLGDDQACQFCSNWGCDYCKPDWFDSLLLEQGGPPDTRDGCGISDPGSKRHQNVHAGGALRVVHPAHRNSASTGAVTYQHKPSATLNPAATDNVTASRLNIGNAFSPALNGFKDFGSSKFEGSVPKYPPRFATPDILCDFEPNPRGDAVECWNNGTGLNFGSSSISGGGCCDTTSENVHWSSGDLSTKFSTMHEPPPSDTDFSDAGKFEKSNTIPTNNETLALEPYTVTYWATVECGDHITHIPLDSNNVTGSEKMILDGPAKKVWKWVQDKGLVNSISLQDAYDLAKDIQKSGIEHHAKDIEEGVGDIREGSRADSLVAVGGG